MPLLDYLRKHRQELNFAQISRRAGFDESYLKHVVAGRLTMSAEAERRIRAVLEEIVGSFPPDGGEGGSK